MLLYFTLKKFYNCFNITRASVAAGRQPTFITARGANLCLNPQPPRAPQLKNIKASFSSLKFAILRFFKLLYELTLELEYYFHIRVKSSTLWT